MSELTSYQIDFIKESENTNVRLAAQFGLTPNQVIDIKAGEAPRGTEKFVLGRGPGTQAAVDAILAGGPTPLGSIPEASGFRVEIIDGVEVKIHYGPRGQDYIKSWEQLYEPYLKQKQGRLAKTRAERHNGAKIGRMQDDAG